MKTTQHFPIKLDLPQVVALLVVFGRHVVQSMTNNPWFPSPSPPLADISKGLDDLESSEVAVRSGTKGTAAVRDGHKAVTNGHMVGLKGYVGLIASQNAAHAIEIIESAGMTPRKAGTREKPPLAARVGPNIDEVLLRAKAAGKRAAYEWQYSSDGGKSWIVIGTTTVASTSLQGVSAGTYLFRVRSTVKRTTSNWSQTVSLSVH
jgi:hypothetical protein